MISESLGGVWAVESLRPRDSTSLMISQSLVMCGMSNPCVNRDSSSLIISESLGGVWAVESVRHP